MFHADGRERGFWKSSSLVGNNIHYKQAGVVQSQCDRLYDRSHSQPNDLR